MDDKEISEELLSAYLDGELEGPQLSQVERALRSTPALESDLRALRYVREQVGAHLRVSVGEQKLNFWSAIESKLDPRPVQPVRPKAGERAGVYEWLSAFKDGVGRAGLSYKVVAGFGVAMFALGLATSQWVDLPAQKGAARKDFASNDLRNNEQGIEQGKTIAPVLVPLLPDNLQGSGSEVKFVSNAASGPVIAYSPQFVRPTNLGAEHLARNAGYRAGGIDIEWLQSPKGVKLLRPSNRQVPPVLWVGAQ